MTMDVYDKATRSRVMRAVKSKDTRPEKSVRTLLHKLGYRFRLHRRDLPGSPDIVLPARRVIMFVHGCFWHGHDCPRGSRTPKTNAEYWKVKRSRNIDRDKRIRDELEDQGWRVLVIWECETKDEEHLAENINNFIQSKPFKSA